MKINKWLSMGWETIEYAYTLKYYILDCCTGILLQRIN